MNTHTLTLDRLYNTKDFDEEHVPKSQWLDDGNSYTLLEDSKTIKGAQDIVAISIANGNKKVLVSAEQLLLDKKENTFIKINAYSFSQGAKKLLIFTNAIQKWRYSKSGDYWVIDLSTGEKTQIGKKTKPASLYFAELSPDGSHVAYMFEHNLYVENLKNNKIKQLTDDGTSLIVNGGFDWAYEEEFSLNSGFRWSPDGSKIAYWQLDMSGVGTFNMINNTDDIYSKIVPMQYPKAGTTNSAVKTGVVSIDKAKTNWFKFDGNSRNYYLPRMQWTKDSNHVVIQHMNRKQNTLTLYLGDPESGKIEQLIQDKSDAWLDPVDDLVWFDKDKYFTWISDQDGWERVYIYTRDGKESYAITPEKTDVISIESINPETGWLYFTASPENATQKYLYQVKLDGKSQAERVTPADLAGTHDYNITPNQQWAIHSYSQFDTPDSYQLIELPGHKSKTILADNSKLNKALLELDQTPSSYFKVTIDDGLDIDGWMIKPHDFDPSLKYPVIFYVYAEPWNQTVADRWGGIRHLWHKMLAQLGYVVVSVDNRGTPAPRGRAWRKSIYGKIGSLTSADQAAAAQKVVAWDFIDEKRVAIWGRSGGGTHTLHALFRYPDLYQTGISVAPVADLRLYDTIYQERYTGIPPDDLNNYTEGSAITYAHQLKGNLLLIHGTGDDNVHYQGTEMLINKLIEHNLPFYMVPYPNRGHGIRRGKNTSLHKRETMLRFFLQHTPPGGVKR